MKSKDQFNDVTNPVSEEREPVTCTCDECPMGDHCEYSRLEYNTNGNCLFYEVGVAGLASAKNKGAKL